MRAWFAAPLSIGLVLLALGAVIVQALIPGEAAFFEEGNPEVAGTAVPLAVLAIAAIACIQAVLVMIARLVVAVGDDAIFDPSSLRWVSAIVVALGIATALTVAAWVVVVVATPGGPAAVIFLPGVILAGLVATTLMAVMRGLLVKAIAFRSELQEVI